MSKSTFRSPLRRIAFAFSLTTLLAFAPIACDRSTTTAQGVDDPRIKLLPTVDVAIAGRQFKLEVADDDAEREQGLMYRTSMPTDHGMLFVFDAPTDGPFWMKNTNIPLDIAYVDSNGVVKTVATMIPHDLSPIASEAPYQYAIEINAGVASRIGLKPGDQIQLPIKPKKPAM